MKKMLGGYFLLLIYFLGIGFISGSIVHFTLNPRRFGLIGIVGGILFAIATYIQDFWGHEDKDTSRSHILYRVLIGVFLSIGLGMISGSIQHFDEITYEALRYIPIGTGLSLIARWLQEKEHRQGLHRLQWTSLTIGLIFFSILTSGYIKKVMFPDGPVGGHHEEGNTDAHVHDESHAHDQGEFMKLLEKKENKEIRHRTEFSNEEKMNMHMCLMGHGDNCIQILDPANKTTYADALQEQCDIMSGMEACATYFDTELPEDQEISYFNTTITDGLPKKQVQTIVELQNGDSYTLELQDIQTTLGGHDVRMLGYNGSIPGPLIKVPQGAQISLKVQNMIKDITSTVHHHGLRLDNKEDGVPKSMGGYDDPLNYGELKTYTLDFPDEGVYRYHPHVREDLQQELGLYGNYLVLPDDEDDRNSVNHEEMIVLDDILLDDAGIFPVGLNEVSQVIMGRFGNVNLVNGQETYSFSVDKGAVTRLYITNVANVQPFYLRLRQQTGQDWQQMKLIGGDVGRYEQESLVDGILIAPAERYIVEIATPQAGTYELVQDTPLGTQLLTTIQVSEQEVVTSYLTEFATLEKQQEVIADIDQYRDMLDKEIDHTLRFDMTIGEATADDMQLKMHGHEERYIDMGGLSYNLGNIERQDDMFAMNAGSSPETVTWKLIDEATGEENMDINRSFVVGDVVKVRLINDDKGLHPMQHPIHFHGQRFLVVSKNGITNDNLVWKDTVLTTPGDEIDILLDMSNPGKRMAHCHIAEHMHAGMMMNFVVNE